MSFEQFPAGRGPSTSPRDYISILQSSGKPNKIVFAGECADKIGDRRFVALFADREARVLRFRFFSVDTLHTGNLSDEAGGRHKHGRLSVGAKTFLKWANVSGDDVGRYIPQWDDDDTVSIQLRQEEKP